MNKYIYIYQNINISIYLTRFIYEYLHVELRTLGHLEVPCLPYTSSYLEAFNHPRPWSNVVWLGEAGAPWQQGTEIAQGRPWRPHLGGFPGTKNPGETHNGNGKDSLRNQGSQLVIPVDGAEILPHTAIQLYVGIDFQHLLRVLTINVIEGKLYLHI